MVFNNNNFILIAFAIILCAFDGNFVKCDVEVDDVLNNETLLKVYFDCLIDKGECPKEGKEIKEKIPEALENGCKKCTDAEKTDIGKVIVHLLKEKPEYWEALVVKYDPDGKYNNKYADKLAEKKAKA